MADNNKVRIWIQLADANQIALSVNPDEEESYRKAEELVNTLWRKWMNRFKDSSEDVLARVAFQFARLYLEAYGENRQVNDFLTDLNQQLDTLLSEDK
ncbi:MAG: cell division protein ZapA [Muribaculaceae bacterium]|nr:cell division protein ZapA [Muribaculaceae bacterium]